MRNNIDIICTLGKRHFNEESILSFAAGGMTILRLNASHITDEAMPDILELVHLAKAKSAFPFRVMLDLPGPEYRVFGFDKPLSLKMGDELHICTQGYHDKELSNVIYTNCIDFDTIRLNDATVKFMNGEITGLPAEITKHWIKLMILTDGILRPDAHINFVHSDAKSDFLTKRDAKLSKIGMQYNVDMIALSMVKTADDLFRYTMSVLDFSGKKRPQIVVKFETEESLYHIKPIMDLSDACFVARGDLGLSIPPEAIPLIQKKILSIATEMDKPVYIATGMMTSMLESETPTRAEINDIATAIIDGAAGVTLSEETAIGKYPLQTIQAVKKIIDTIKMPNTIKMPYLEPKTELQEEFWSNILDEQDYGAEIRSLINIGNMIWQRGWAEANAGNVSFRFPCCCGFMTGMNLLSIGQQLTGKPDFDFTLYDWYLVSATGSRYREIEKRRFGNFVLVMQLTPTRANGYTFENAPLYAYPPDRKPTSEWRTHHAVQVWLRKHHREDNVVLHAHSTDWITIGNLPEYTANPEQLMIDVRRCLPELDIYFPAGIALAPYAAPGSDELCAVTLDAIEHSNIIIWQKHGVFITAKGFDAAFDYLEIISKAAAVYLQLRK